MTAIVMDASFAAAWLLPDEHSEDVETVIARIRQPCVVPHLFWHETCNILVTAERRKRMEPGEAVLAIRRLRRLPLVSSDIGTDENVIALAIANGLSAYDAAYLAISLDRKLPLATLDHKLADAVLKNGVQLVGPLRKGDGVILQTSAMIIIPGRSGTTGSGLGRDPCIHPVRSCG